MKNDTALILDELRAIRAAIENFICSEEERRETNRAIYEKGLASSAAQLQHERNFYGKSTLLRQTPVVPLQEPEAPLSALEHTEH